MSEEFPVPESAPDDADTLRDLRRRLSAAERERASVALATSDRVFLFATHGVTFAVPAACVVEVLPMAALTRLPADPSPIAGWFQRRSDWMPVIDPSLERNRCERAVEFLISCRTDTGPIAFRADQLKSVEEVRGEDLQPLAPHVTDREFLVALLPTSPASLLIAVEQLAARFSSLTHEGGR